MDSSRNRKSEQVRGGEPPEFEASQNDNSRNDAELVAQRAYQRYEERGREDGHDMEDWLEAERELRRSSARKSN